MLNKTLNVSIKNTIQSYHWEESLALLMVLQGEMQLVASNRREVMKKGDISLVNGGAVFCIESKSDDLIYVQLMLDTEQFERYITEISSSLFKCGHEENDPVSENLKMEIKKYIAAIVKLVTKREDAVNVQQKVIYYCIQILSILKLRFAFVGKSLNEISSHEKFNQLWKVIDYVYKNYERKLTVKEVADYIYVSTSYLSRLLKEQIGESFEGFLSFVRAESSLRPLLESDKSIATIAYGKISWEP